MLFQPIRLDDGAPYLDGGCSDAIPWKRALAVGCDRVVVVLTRERSYRKEPEQLMPLFRRVYRKYPVFLEGLRTRAERYNQCREELFALEQEGRVLVIAPANTRGFSRTERDRQEVVLHKKSVLLFAFYHIFTQILQNLRNPLSSVPLCIYNVGAQYT